MSGAEPLTKPRVGENVPIQERGANIIEAIRPLRQGVNHGLWRAGAA
jgi:hypothetical protein